VLEFELDPQEAINVPHYQNRNDNTVLEAPMAGVTLKYNAMVLSDELTLRNHTVNIVGPDDAFPLDSGVAIIEIKGRRLIGGADYRRDEAVA